MTSVLDMLTQLAMGEPKCFYGEKLIQLGVWPTIKIEWHSEGCDLS